MRKHIRKIISGITALLIIFSLSLCSFAQNVSSQKEEVVYANLNSDGTVDGVYVVNIFSPDGTVTDYGNYSSVRNMTTSDIINKNDDTITISSTADKLYYEGTLSEAQLPWNIAIKYYLDGTEYSADDIAGKNGHLEIKMSITQNDNADTSFFNNFALQASVKLDTKLASNITSNGATIANIGSLKQLSYTVLPKTEADISINTDVTEFEMQSIEINAVKLNLNVDIDTEAINEQITVLQDGAVSLDSGALTVKNGAEDLYASLTELLSGLNTLKETNPELTDTINTIYTNAETLSDNAQSIYTGSNDLYNGIFSLSAKVPSLTQGLSTLSEGAQSLSDGTSSLSNGAVSLSEATATLQNGMSSISTDSTELSDGINEVNSQSSELLTGAKDLQDGLSQLSEAINSLTPQNPQQPNDNFDEILDGSDRLNDKISALSESIEALNNAGNEYYSHVDEMLSQNTGGLISSVEGLISANAQMATLVSQSQGDMNQKITLILENAHAQTIEEAKNYYNDICIQYEQNGSSEGLTIVDYRDAVTALTTLSLSGQFTQMGESISQLLDANNQVLQSDRAFIMGMDYGDLLPKETTLGYNLNIVNEAINHPDDYKMGLSGAYDSFNTGLHQMSDRFDNIEALSQRITQLYNGSQSLYSGLQGYTTGVNKAYVSSVKLSSGISSLSSSAQGIQDSTLSFENSISSLTNGMQSLRNSIITLNSQTPALTDGTNDILYGAENLKNSTYTLSKETESMYSGIAQLVKKAPELADNIELLYNNASPITSSAYELMNGTNALYNSTTELQNKTSNMDTQLEVEINQVTNDITGTNNEIVSFASPKNTNVQSVQFVIKTPAIEKPAEAIEEQTTTEVKLSFWQKFLKLFGLY